MWTTTLPSKRSGEAGLRERGALADVRIPTKAAGTPRCATVRNARIVISHKAPNAASHSRIAFSSIASNTGARSPGEELMTCKYLGGRGLLLHRFVALAQCLIKPPLQLSVGTPKLGYLVVERRGHVLLRRALSIHDSAISTGLHLRRVRDPIGANQGVAWIGSLTTICQPHSLRSHGCCSTV